MKIFCERLTSATVAELGRIQDIYETNFPPSERKPFEYFVPRIEAGDYICMVARPENTLHQIAAFAFLMLLPGAPLAFLEYVAVDNSAHGQGVGSELFREMATYFRENDLARGVVWEVEPPTDDPADDKNRRIRFYERLGAQMLDASTPYAMPNYERNEGGVPLRLMQLPLEKQPTPAEVSAIVKGIYQVAYTDWFTLRDQIVRGLAELSA